jgi:hypothetical protein
MVDPSPRRNSSRSGGSCLLMLVLLLLLLAFLRELLSVPSRRSHDWFPRSRLEGG